MTTSIKSKIVDWGGLTLRVKKIELGSTKPGSAGTEVTSDAGELNILDGVTATAAEINNACDVSTRIVALTSATATITAAAHASKIITLARATGIACTLPAATGTGDRYEFIILTQNSSTNVYSFVRAGSDTICGHSFADDGDGEPANGWSSTAATTVTLGGTNQATGGNIGDRVVFQDIASTIWYCNALCTQGGTEATPFS